MCQASMKPTKKFIPPSIILLVFNGISALIGGILLIADPTGAYLDMPLDLLEHSPFKNFLIPGMLLLALNGISSLLIAFTVATSRRHRFTLTAVQGVISTVCILTQVYMIQSISVIHLVYGGIGIALIIIGTFKIYTSKSHRQFRL